MKALQYLKRVAEWIGAGLVFAMIIAVIFLAGGGMAIFASPDNCTGERDIRVGEATTFWEIAEREFPYDDPRVVTDRLLAMNDGDYDTLLRSTIKGPLDC